MSDMNENETDIETTGHEWDGIKEYDNPLPRWWLWTWYICIAWAVAYMIAMPAVPLISDYTKGLLGYSQRQVLENEIKAAKAAHADLNDELVATELTDISPQSDLYRFAVAGGRSAFAVNCSQCHGSGASGAPGYPNLNDDDWLWGGSIDDIYLTIKYGIRDQHEESRSNDMPAFLIDEMLDKEQISVVTDYVLSLSGTKAAAENINRGKAIYADQCASCHGDNARGITELGAPDLADAIWFYGGDKETVMRTVSNGRQNVMPAWVDRLEPAIIRQLTLFVHSLGGGE